MVCYGKTGNKNAECILRNDGERPGAWEVNRSAESRPKQNLNGRLGSPEIVQ